MIRQAVSAVGGAEAVSGVATLVLTGYGDAYNLGQNAHPYAELPRFEVTEYRKSIDFTNRLWREDLVRIPRFVTSNPDPQRRITAVDNGIAFDVSGGGTFTRRSDTEGAMRDALLYHHPLSILQVAMNPESHISNLRSLGSEQSVTVVGPDGAEFTLYVDATTGLPSRVQSMGYFPGILGDLIVETHFGEYEEEGGLRLPTRITSQLDRFTVLSVTVSSTVNGETGEIRAPDEIKSALVRTPAVPVEVEQVGRGLWFITGGSHNSIVVEFADHLTLIEAPQDDIRTLAVIETARRLNPEIPLTEVINTHHHFDHSAGLRTAVSENLKIITHEANQTFYETSISRPHRIAPDALQRNPRPLEIETVSEPLILSDATRTVEIYPIANNPHSDTLLMIYFPAERALAVADVYSTPRPGAGSGRFPFVANLVENVENYNLRVERILPVHGTAEPFSNVLQVAAEQASAAAASTD